MLVELEVLLEYYEVLRQKKFKSEETLLGYTLGQNLACGTVYWGLASEVCGDVEKKLRVGDCGIVLELLGKKCLFLLFCNNSSLS